MARGSSVGSVAAAAGMAVLFATVSAAPAQQRAAPVRWITAWATSQQGPGTNVVTNATVRMMARVTIAGEAVRIRLDNTFGTAPLSIGKTYVGQRIQGAALAANSNRQVFFDKSATVIVPAGGTVTSDPVRLNVLAHQDLAVSFHVPGANVRPSQHGAAHVTSYLTPDGRNAS